MASIGRIIVPGFPHHVTQPGNRRQQGFFQPSDYALYRDGSPAAVSSGRSRGANRAVMAEQLELKMKEMGKASP